MDKAMLSEFPEDFTRSLLDFCDAPAPEPTFLASLEQSLTARQASILRTIPAKGKPFQNEWGHVAGWLARAKWQTAVLFLAVVLLAFLIAVGPQRVWAAVLGLFGYIPGIGFVQSTDQTRVLAAPFEARQGNSTLVVQQVIAGPDNTIVVVNLTSTPEEIYVRMQEWVGLVTLILPDGQRLTPRHSSETVSAGKISAEFAYPALPVEVFQVTLEIPKLPVVQSSAQEFWSVSLPLQAVGAVSPYTPKNGQVSNQGVTVHVLQVGQSAQDTGVLVQIDWNDPTWDYTGSGAELRDNLGKVYQRMEPYPGSPDVYNEAPRGRTSAQEMLRFPALDSNARQVTLSLSGIMFEIHPQVEFEFDPGKAAHLYQTWSFFADDPTKRLKIAGFQVQVLQADLAYAPYSDQVKVVNPPSATALPQPTPLPGYACRLEFILQITPQAHARLYPGTPHLLGGNPGLSGASSMGDGTRATIYLDLMEIPTKPMTIQLNDANLMLEGEWQISWDLPKGTP